MSVPQSNQPTDRTVLSSTRAGLVLVVILSIFAIAPLFYPGYIQTHSGFVILWNVSDLRARWDLWNWLPHVATQFDLLRGDGLLPYYLAAFLPVEPAAAVKVVLGLGWLLGSIGMFLWLKSWLGQTGALVAALVYTYLPYQIATVYVRGAWGEALFWGLLPWAMLSATFLVASPKLWLLPVAAGFWLLLGLSQLGLALWAFLFASLLVLIIHWRQSLRPILAAGLGIGAALVLYLPRVAWPVDSWPVFANHFLYPFQLFSAFWGFGVSRPGWNDGLSLQLGLAALGLTLVSVILWQRSGVSSAAGRTDRRLIFFLSAVILLSLLQLGVAAFIWRIPIGPDLFLANTLTYPWQLLGLTGLCLAILAGASLWLDRRLAGRPLYGAIIVFILLSSFSYLAPQFSQSSPPPGPQAQLGDDQLILLEHSFAVSTSGNTAGLPRGEIALPVTLYGPPQENDVLRLNVVWQPLRPFDQNLKVFVHLVDSGGNVLAQYDGYPQKGEYPTTDWIPGELIEDSYPLFIPADAPDGPYQAFLGLYDEATLARLPVATDPEGRVILNVE